MGSRTIRLDDDVYERLREAKRDDETYSEAVERLLPGASLLDLAGILDSDEVAEIEDRLSEKYSASKERRREQFRN